VPTPSTLHGRLDGAVAQLTPGYFALVMATGIVSIGMRTNASSIIASKPTSASVMGQVVACAARRAPGTNTLNRCTRPLRKIIAAMKYTNGPTAMRSTSVVSP